MGAKKKTMRNIKEMILMGKSRNEDILQYILDGTEYTETPKSREEDLLIQLKDAIEAGGGQGRDKQNSK